MKSEMIKGKLIVTFTDDDIRKMQEKEDRKEYDFFLSRYEKRKERKIKKEYMRKVKTPLTFNPFLILKGSR